MANIIKQLKDSNGNNIYPIAYAQGGMKMDLLWTNPSPTASFSAQTISVDLSEYDLVVVCIRSFPLNDGDSGFSNLIGYKELRSVATIAGSSSNKNGRRRFTPSDTGVEFESCTYDGNTYNNFAVPIYIYGVKMSYVVPTSVHGLQYVEV